MPKIIIELYLQNYSVFGFIPSLQLAKASDTAAGQGAVGSTWSGLRRDTLGAARSSCFSW